MVLPRFVQAAMTGQPIIVHDDGLQERCFAHVSDIVGAVVQLVENSSAHGRVYNIGSNRPHSILELARRVQSIVNPKVEIQHQSYSQAYDNDFEDVRRRVPDLTRIRQAIGFEHTKDIDAIIHDVWNYQRSLSTV